MAGGEDSQGMEAEQRMGLAASRSTWSHPRVMREVG